MLNGIIRLAIYNRGLVILAFLAMIVMSILILPSLNLDAFPDVTNVQVVVNTEARGLAAAEVEQLITYPIESVMYAIPDVQEVRSISRVGLSVVTIVFKDNVNIYFARQQVFERLQYARTKIPQGIAIPEMGPNTSSLGQVFQYILTTNDPIKYDNMTLRSLNDWVVKLLLAPVDGVTHILSFGGHVRQYQVLVDPGKLLSYHLTISHVVKTIEENNRNAGGWYFDKGAEQFIIRGYGWVNKGEKGLKDIANIALKDKDGVVVRVKDVAQVQYGSEIRQGAVTMTKRDAKGTIVPMNEVVAGIVLKRIGANTKKTIDGIYNVLPLIQKALPTGVFIVPVYDQSNLIQGAIKTIVRALLEAFCLIFVVLLLFLMNLRATLLVLISIPFSICIALILMAHFGLSANQMSLGGLSIAIGMMVDGAVVIMENIFRRLSQRNNNRKNSETTSHQSIQQTIQNAVYEVARPVFFAVMIIIVVFLPIFSLQSIEGKLFHPLAISIIIAMLASIFVALVVIPALATYCFQTSLIQRKNYMMIYILHLYQSLLEKALEHKGYVIASAIGLLLGSLLLFPFLGSEFSPELEEGTLNIRVTLAPSVSLHTAIDISTKLERELLSFPEVIYASGRIGRPELGFDADPVSNIEIYVGLKPVHSWTSAKNRINLQKLMKEKMSIYPGLLFTFSQPIATRIDELVSGTRAQLAVKLFGHDLGILSEKGKEIEQIMRQVRGTRDVAIEQIVGETQLLITPDREALMRYGMSVGQVMSFIADAIGGKEAGQVINGNERYDIYVRLADWSRNSIESIENLTLSSPNGAWVRLKNVAQVEVISGPPQIRRDNVQRRVVIQANIENRDLGSVVAEIQERIAKEVKLPTGYRIVYGGEFENQQRAQARLMIVIPIALALIFLLLYFSFGSFSKAFLVMVNVPLALIGGIFALFISGQYLSVPGSVGFIALFGIAVLNGVVLINAIHHNKEQHMSTREAVMKGAISRVRPVLMTAFITAIGLIPILLSKGIGAEIQRPLATVVFGGLLSSTALTLILLPVLYELFFKAARSHSA